MYSRELVGQRDSFAPNPNKAEPPFTTILPPPKRFGGRTVMASVLVLIANGLMAASLFLPWWRFWLYAPQYPGGLSLIISLRGVGGDVHEVDLLNHYIGMGHLEGAAPFERAHAPWGVGAVIATTLLFFALSILSATTEKGSSKWRSSRRWLPILPAALFPIGFIADSFYWLHRFGHHLDPKAPLKLAPFTPEMFGNGVIGQFETFARPESGFWLAVSGTVLVVVATILMAGPARRKSGPL